MRESWIARPRRRRTSAVVAVFSLIVGLLVLGAEPVSAATVTLSTVAQTDDTGTLSITWQTDLQSPLPAQYRYTVKASNPLSSFDFDGPGSGILTTPTTATPQTFTVSGLSPNTTYRVCCRFG